MAKNKGENWAIQFIDEKMIFALFAEVAAENRDYSGSLYRDLLEHFPLQATIFHCFALFAENCRWLSYNFELFEEIQQYLLTIGNFFENEFKNDNRVQKYLEWANKYAFEAFKTHFNDHQKKSTMPD